MTTPLEYLIKKKLDEKSGSEQKERESAEILQKISNLLDTFQIEDLTTVNKIFTLYKKFVSTGSFSHSNYHTGFWDDSREIYTSINDHLISTDYMRGNPRFSYIMIDTLWWDADIFGLVFRGRVNACFFGFDKKITEGTS
jgi:hypothetical protein